MDRVNGVNGFQDVLLYTGSLSLCFVGSFPFQESSPMEDMIDVVVNDVFFPVLKSFTGDENGEMGNGGLLNPFLDGTESIGIQIEVETYACFFSKEILDAVQDVKNDLEITLEDTGIELIL